MIGSGGASHRQHSGPELARSPVTMTARILVIVATIVLCACAAPVKLPTPSGNPEITMTGADPDEIAGEITDRFVTAGFEVADAATLRRMVFERVITDSSMHTMLLGSTHDPFPTLRIVATVNKTRDVVRVMLVPEYVTNAGTAFESRLPNRNAEDLRTLQALLDAVRMSAADSPSHVATATSNATTDARRTAGGSNGYAPPTTAPPKNDFNAGQVARTLGCEAPKLLNSTPSTETYQVACPGGQYKLISCEFSNCRVMQ